MQVTPRRAVPPGQGVRGLSPGSTPAPEMGGGLLQKVTLRTESQHSPGSPRAAVYTYMGCVPSTGLSSGASEDGFSHSHVGISCQLVAALFPFQENVAEAADGTVLQGWLWLLVPWPGGRGHQGKEPAGWDPQNWWSVHVPMGWERAPGSTVKNLVPLKEMGKPQAYL